MDYRILEDGILIIYNGCKKIPTRAFYNNTKIKIVIIPKSVRKIGKKAFYLCSNLEEVVIHTHGVQFIEDKAFCCCFKLARFTAIFKKSIVFSNKNIAFLYFYINYFIYNI